MHSLDEFATAKLGELERSSLRRALVDTTRVTGLWLSRNGRRLLSFCCNDYLNLTHHPAVKEAAIEALRVYGVGAGASRFVTGNHPLFSELEARLARLKETEGACVFGSGYLANLGIIPALVGPGDLVLIDELAHACLWAGARLSRARLLTFPHNAAPALAGLLGPHRSHYRQCLVMTEGVFSMDGDLAPLPEMSAAAGAHDAWLLTDDAHGLGVLGGGRGSAFAFGRPIEIPLQMGTLSKALGSYGAYLCASEPVIDLVKTRARSLIYSTALPPASLAAALASLDMISCEPERAARPLAKARAFTRAMGLAPATSPIVPILLGDAARALAAQRTLEEEGFLGTAIRPPTVPAGTARLRLAFTADHPEPEVARLAAVLQEKILQCPVSS